MGSQAADRFYYRVIHAATEVNVGRDRAWAKIGEFDALGDLFNMPCEYISGSGGLGSVRLVANEIVEALIGATDSSYTYSQVHGPMAAYDYHCTLACENIAARQCRITSTVIYNQAGMNAEKQEHEAVRTAKRNGYIVSHLKKILEEEA